jgi:hypothetical protein
VLRGCKVVRPSQNRPKTGHTRSSYLRCEGGRAPRAVLPFVTRCSTRISTLDTPSDRTRTAPGMLTYSISCDCGPPTLPLPRIRTVSDCGFAEKIWIHVQRWRLIVMGHYKSTILQRAHRRRAFSNFQWGWQQEAARRVGVGFSQTLR